MYSDNPSILQLAALLKAHGVKDAVLCPGSRNAAIVHTLTQVSDFKCHSITDERSAGFFALGLALQTGLPTVICVTSGSALLNVYPAVAEAYYQHVPLVVISADRPSAWIGQMDGQTMPQPEVFGKMVRMSVDLPENNTEEGVWHCNRLINEALLECVHRGQGPVHINVPIPEPIYEFHTTDLPKVRKIDRLEGMSPANGRILADLLRQTKKRMIIIGQKTPDRMIHKPFLNNFEKGFVSLAENLANLGTGNVALGDLSQRIENIPAGQEEDYRPDLVITLCGHIISKPLKRYLRKYPPKMHWHVSPDGEIADLFCCLTHVIEAKPYEFLEGLGYLMIPFDEDGAYNNLWKNINIPETSKESVVGKLIKILPDNAVLHLANSSTIREAQHFKVKDSITVCCNRGINGIEGSMSTAVGYATASPERPNFLIIGDLSFFYDQNALWNRNLPNNLHILLINSKGGRIFDTLPIPDEERSKDAICGTHNTTAEAACLEYGIRYLKGEQTLKEFVESKETILLEIEL